MTHIFRINSITSDLFVYEITPTHITYEVRGKDDGKLLEPRRVSKYELHSDKRIYFDSRDLPADLVVLIVQILNG